MLNNLTANFSNILKNIRGQARLTETNIQDMLQKIQQSFLEADVAVSVIDKFILHIKKRAVDQRVLEGLTPSQMLVDIVREELVVLLGQQHQALNLATVPPAILLVAGLQGTGKTTTAGKLGALLKKQKKKVLLASVDMYRPAAIEQLKLLAEQAGVAYFESDAAQIPLSNAEAAKNYAKRYFFDVLILDTAGRLAIDQIMMDEIKAIHELVKPIETLFVVDAMQGQDAANTAHAFGNALPLTGLIITKLDSDSRGGAALSARQITGQPIKFIGVSEKIDGLTAFYPDRLANRILGLGDMLSLIEDIKKGTDTQQAATVAKQTQNGKHFNLEDFRQHMQQIQAMGGTTNLLDKMPSHLAQPISELQKKEADKKIHRNEAIINSMTIQERREPTVIKSSRKRRIAAGAGVSIQAVNQLLEQFEQMQKMMKKFSKGGLGKLMQSLQNRFAKQMPIH